MRDAIDDGADWRTELERGADEAPCRVDLLRARQPGRGRDATTPVDIPAVGWKDVAWRMVLAFSANRIIAMSGGVAFFALLAIFPAIATVVSLYGLFSNAQTVIEHLDLLTGILPAGILQMVRDQALLVASKSNNTLGIAFATGFGIALWSANSGVSALFDALNVIYGEKEKRSLVTFYATTLVVTFGAVVFVVLALAAVVFLPIVLGFMGLNTPAEKILMVARWPVLLVFVAAALSTIYRLGPSRREAKWHWVTLGSAAAALLWVGASMLFSWYVTAFDSYNRIYGSLGAAVGFMTWTWISAMIVLLGALLNAELEHQTAHDTTDGPPKPLGLRGATMADHVGAAASEL
jgi:membrane protein